MVNPSSTILLILIGILSEIFYMQLYAPLPGNILFTILFSLFFCSVWVVRRHSEQSNVAIILIFAILFNATLIKLPLNFSGDVNAYIAGAKIYTYYHENPFAVLPNKFPNDEIVSLGAYPHHYAYGPVWLYISALLHSLAGPDNLELNRMFFKTFAALFSILNSLLIYDILRRFGNARASLGLLFYAWNPLVVIEAAGMGHNDVVMAGFLLLFINLLLRGRESLATVFLSLAILTKHPAAIVLLPYSFFLLKKDKIKLIKQGAILGFIGTAMYLPFWEGLQTFQGLWICAKIYGRSLLAVVWVYTSLAWGDDVGRILTSIVQALLVLLFAHYLLRSSLSVTKAESVLSAIPRIYLVYLFAAATIFWPWYLFWVVPFAALLEWSKISEFTLLFCFSSMISYFVQGYSIVLISFGIPILFYILSSEYYKYRNVNLMS